MSTTRVRWDERGYTLAELLTAMAVLGLLMAALFLTLHEGQTVYLYGAGRAEVQQNARVALERMLRELRTSCSVATAQPNDVKFTFLDENGTSGCGGAGATGPVTVEYNLNGTNLQRIETVPNVSTATLVGGVSAFTVTYYNINNVATTDAASVYAVDVSITTRSENTALAASSPANRRATVAGRVRLRNE